MSDIDAMLERLITDPGFRRLFHENPVEALGDYELTETDVDVLLVQLDNDQQRSAVRAALRKTSD